MEVQRVLLAAAESWLLSIRFPRTGAPHDCGSLEEGTGSEP